MARTNVTVLETSPNGILNAEAVDTPLHATDGAMFANNGETRLWLKNGGAGVHVITIPTPRTVDGLAVADKTYSIPAGAYALLGPFPTGTYNQPSGADAGKVYVDSDGTESEVTIIPFRD